MLKSRAMGNFVRSYHQCRLQSNIPQRFHFANIPNRSIPHVTCQRYISQTPKRPCYEGDGKTTVTILNHEFDSPLMVDSYYEKGFTLNNGFRVRGPIAIFPKTVLAWDVGSSADITPESLILFSLLEPRLDILVIGVGDNGAQKYLPKETIQMLKKKKINFEILPTEHALATFNFLNYEGRCTAAALLPPKIIRLTSEDILTGKIHRKRMYDAAIDDFPTDYNSLVAAMKKGENEKYEKK